MTLYSLLEELRAKRQVSVERVQQLTDLYEASDALIKSVHVNLTSLIDGFEKAGILRPWNPLTSDILGPLEDNQMLMHSALNMENGCVVAYNFMISRLEELMNVEE